MAWNNVFNNAFCFDLFEVHLFWPKGFDYHHYHVDFYTNIQSQRKCVELIKTRTLFPEGRRVTVNLCWLHWISNFQLNPAPEQNSPETPLGIIMLSLVFIWDTMHVWTVWNTQFWSLFLHWAPFFSLSNACTECWKPLCSAVSALFIQLPAGCRVAFISGSELTNADTEIIHPVKNSLTRLICGRSPQPLSCTDLQQKIGIIYDWHNHKIALRAYDVCSPPEEATWFPRMLNRIFQTGLGFFAVPTLPLHWRVNPEGQCWGGAGDCILFPYPGAGSPVPSTVYYDSRDTEQSPVALKHIRFTKQGEVRGITDSPFSPADSSLFVFIMTDKQTNHLVSKSKPRNQSHALSNSYIVRGDRSRKDQPYNTLPRLK